MKSLTKTVFALALLSFASAPFAQDDAEDEGGWFSGISSFFSNLFSSDDEGDADSGSGDGGGFGGLEWYGGADAGVTKPGTRDLHSASGSYSGYVGGIFQNRLGFELGYMDLGDMDIRGSAGATLNASGFRGGITLNSEAGDAPVRLGVGYYSVDADVGSASESSSGLTVGVKFEQAVTERMYLTLGTDFLFGVKFGGERTDAIMFGLGLAFHTAQPMPAAAEEDDGIGVTEPAYEADSYDYSSEPADDGMDSGEPADDDSGDDSYE